MNNYEYFASMICSLYALAAGYGWGYLKAMKESHKAEPEPLTQSPERKEVKG